MAVAICLGIRYVSTRRSTLPRSLFFVETVCCVSMLSIDRQWRTSAAQTSEVTGVHRRNQVTSDGYDGDGRLGILQNLREQGIQKTCHPSLKRTGKQFGQKHANIINNHLQSFFGHRFLLFGASPPSISPG